VVSFRTGSLLEHGKFVAGLNYYLPAAIAVTAAYRVSDSVNVRRHAISREYSYYILNRPVPSPTRRRFCHLVAGKLDIEVMNVACRALVGERDFASFASRMGVAIKSTRRRVFSARVERDGEMVVFNIVANSFLPHQVRNTVGALIRVGLGKMTVAEFHSIMEARKPGLAGPSAPPCGLFLDRVNYPADFEEGQFENL
jgi:tRNA pseudouridine38-40 synthase